MLNRRASHRIIILCCLLFSSPLQHKGQDKPSIGFVDIFSLPVPYCFSYYCAPDVDNFWSVGGSTIFHSKGDGSLNKRELPMDSTFYSIHSRGSGIGWIVGSDGNILYTPDNGKTWVRQQSGVRDEALNAVTCVDNRRCWVVGQDSVLRTTDAGLHWQKLTNISAEGSTLQAVSFVDAQTGWIAVHENEVLHTSDGGATWQVQKVGADVAAIDFLEDVQFVDRQTGYVAGWGGVARTIDGGKTWQTVLRGSEIQGNGHFIGLVIRDGGRKVWAVGDERTPNYCSDDGGRSWKPCGLKAPEIQKTARRCP